MSNVYAAPWMDIVEDEEGATYGEQCGNCHLTKSCTGECDCEQ